MQPQQYPQYPPAPPVYPPQQPPAAPPQQYPPQPPQGYPAQAYPPPPPAYAQPPQGYAPPNPYGQPPMPPPIPGTLDDFYSQPSTGGGKALTFETPGTSYIGIVTRAVGNGDIRQQTDTQGRPATFRDGRPKFVMTIPLQMQPSPQYTDGLGQWFVKGNARDELVRAMAAAGAPEGPPEAGAIITITMTGTRPSGAGMNPTKLFAVVYQRPQGSPGPAPAAAPPAVATTPPPAPPTNYQPAPPPVYATNGGQPDPARVNGGQPPQYVPPAAPAIPAATVAQPPPPAAAPVELSAEQRALLATLTGQAAT